MKRTVLILALSLLFPAISQGQDPCPTPAPTPTPTPPPPQPTGLSAQAVAAFYDYHLPLPQETPPGYFGQGSRRFGTTSITWYADSRVATHVREAFGIIAGKMAGVATFAEVPFGTSSATIRFVIANETCVPGVGCIPVGQGCDAIPFLAADRLTYTSAQVTCINPAQVGVALATHELWWHLFLSLIHCPGTGFCSSSATSGAPSWEGGPGHSELARWLHTVPAGSFPPQ